MSDRGLPAIILSAIQQTFGVGRATVDMLQGLAGVLVGSAIALPLTHIADDRHRRPRLLALGV